MRDGVILLLFHAIDQCLIYFFLSRELTFDLESACDLSVEADSDFLTATATSPTTEFKRPRLGSYIYFDFSETFEGMFPLLTLYKRVTFISF